MAELVDLKTMRTQLAQKIKEANMGDCALPQAFKERFTEFGNYRIEEYYQYTLKISSQKSVCIVPNQWIFIAAMCCEYNRELFILASYSGLTRNLSGKLSVGKTGSGEYGQFLSSDKCIKTVNS